MPHYRVYKLNTDLRVVSGEWIEAADDTDALRLAHEMCDEVTPTVEVWQGARRVSVLPCDEPVA